ncbi:hypothetical protein DRF62_18355 [Chryseobacterium piscium]|uniref:Right handed beta helix domain-containing protein n=1 Tax=Chryseobacterium piscium TaxID=333702 RepID=A0A3D9BB84_9FLAO|nr:hypothetical protein [Chryseobacterium piscium]REC50861.1 hypothetical protein DRF62_18355 [Chryseobacterium piscium]
MKKNHLKLIIAAFIISSSLIIHSCGKEEEITAAITVTGIAQDPNNFKGDVTSGQVVTLDPMKSYKLTGIVTVKNGGTLVIPAGTRIIATAGASSYVLVEQGGKIFANGTAGSPVLFTSETTVAGNWGGIVICGKAPINTGNTSSSEIGNLPYGGTEATDNSGALNYVRIEYAGAEFAANKKFNGLSLFGIGNETRVESVALLNNADDGIEIYGGTVNVSNIVSIGNTNHAFSYKDGWIGTATNIYTKRKSDGTGNNGIKGINNATNPTASPQSIVTIKNVTVIGGNDTGEANGVYLSSGAQATIENVVISSWKTGINLQGDATVTYFNGQSKIKDILFNTTNVTTKISATSTVGTSVTILADTYTEKPDATGAGNGILTPTWALGWSGLQ